MSFPPWILLVCIYSSGSPPKVATMTAEYASKPTCVQAGERAVEKFTRKNFLGTVEVSVDFICTIK